MMLTSISLWLREFIKRNSRQWRNEKKQQHVKKKIRQTKEEYINYFKNCLEKKELFVYFLIKYRRSFSYLFDWKQINLFLSFCLLAWKPFIRATKFIIVIGYPYFLFGVYSLSSYIYHWLIPFLFLCICRDYLFFL